MSANGPISYPRKTLILLNLAQISSPLLTPIFIVACRLSTWIEPAHGLLNPFVGEQNVSATDVSETKWRRTNFNRRYHLKNKTCLGYVPFSSSGVRAWPQR